MINCKKKIAASSECAQVSLTTSLSVGMKPLVAETHQGMIIEPTKVCRGDMGCGKSMQLHHLSGYWEHIQNSMLANNNMLPVALLHLIAELRSGCE